MHITHSQGKGRSKALFARVPLMGLFLFLAVAASSTHSIPPVRAQQQSPDAVAACQEAVINGDFESSTSGNWRFGPTAAQGAVVADPVHAGSSALRLGLSPTATNANSHSTAYQTVTIPASTQRATLAYWERPGTAGDSGDYREVIALRPNLTILRSLIRTNGSGDAMWREQRLDLTALAGQTFILYFNVYNNGSGTPFVAYLDAISLQLCDETAPPTATPTNPALAATATPVSTPAPVRVRAGTTQAAPGATTVVVPLDLVVLTDRVNIGVLSLELQYNAAYLKATACTVSETMELLLCNIATPGRIRLAGVAVRGIRSEVNLANLTFELLQGVDQTVPLTVQVLLTGNVDGAAVSTDGQDGAITLHCPPEAETCSGLNIYLPLVNR